MASPQGLSMAGFAATAVSFGPGRIGFGLFLPQLRDAFDLSSAQAGFITSLAFLAFLAALPVASWITHRAGQRTPVTLGVLSAAVGFILVASASSLVFLTAGVVFAGASAGFCWTPFNDAAAQVLSPGDRAGVLSAVSTGATLGVALAAGLFLATTLSAFDWRWAWAIFALMAGAALALAGRQVPAGGAQPGAAFTIGELSRFLQPRLTALYAVSLCFGAVNAVYLAYAALHVTQAGGLTGLPDPAASAVIFLIYGVSGLSGLAAGRLEAQLGLRLVLTGIFLAFSSSLCLLALYPGSWAGVAASAGLHGAAVMMVSAVLSFWSLRLFPDNGSSGFTAALIAVAAGSMAGPAGAGALVAEVGAAATLVVFAALPLMLAVALAVKRDPTSASLTAVERF